MYENLPTTKEEAKRLGAKRYFTGKLCCRGHLSPRYTYGACVACKSETRKRPPRKLVPLEIKKAKAKERTGPKLLLVPRERRPRNSG